MIHSLRKCISKSIPENAETHIAENIYYSFLLCIQYRFDPHKRVKNALDLSGAVESVHMTRDGVLLSGPERAQRTSELRLHAALETQVACQRLLVLIVAATLETVQLVR